MRNRLVVFLIAVVALGGVALAGTKAKASSKNVVKTKSSSAPARVNKSAAARIDRDVNQLETVLIGMTGKAKISERAWKSSSNEANTLANRIFASVQSAKAEEKAIKAATQLRDRVNRLHKEAHRGDIRDARRYAQEALRYAYRLDEWAG